MPLDFSTQANEHSDADAMGASSRSEARKGRMALPDLLTSAGKVINLQLRIWLLQAKISAIQIATAAALLVVALFLVLLSIIFLHVGIFHLLTDILHLAAAWSYLILAAIPLIAAALLSYAAVRTLRKHKIVREARAADANAGLDASRN